ncbi:MAG: hypothetical protein EA422_05200 [Gemmatimonadales bacterium]|nr:MAG: hypothetical protein EA422_05200 [Gemmatimonadales bacterium]
MTESSWKTRLKALMDETGGDHPPLPRQPLRVRGFISDTVVPAFEEVAEGLQEYGRDVEVEYGDRSASIRVLLDGKEEFFYAVRIKAYQTSRFAFPILPLRDPEGRTYRAEIHLRDRALHQDVTDCDKDEIISYFLHDYGRHLRWSL